MKVNDTQWEVEVQERRTCEVTDWPPFPPLGDCTVTEKPSEWEYLMRWWLILPDRDILEIVKQLPDVVDNRTYDMNRPASTQCIGIQSGEKEGTR